MKNQSRHQCLIYEGAPSRKLPLIGLIIQSKLQEGYRCMYLNSAPMVSGIRSTLFAMGFDVVSETEKGRLVLSSDPVTTDGKFDMDVMLEQLEDSINQAVHDGYKGLWVSGDMTWEFGAWRDFSSLMEYELHLEELFSRRKELCGICQYHKDTLPESVMRTALHVHPSIVINETLFRINPYHLQFSSYTDLDTNRKLDEMIHSLCRI